MSFRHAAVAGLAAFALAIALAGCTAPSAEPKGHAAVVSAPPPSVSASPTPAPTWTPGPPLSGVIASGTLTSADGGTSGKIALIASGNTVTATLSDFHTTASGQLDLLLSPRTAGAKCAADSYTFVMNGIDGDPVAWTLPITAGGGPFAPDPTFLHSAVLRADSETGKPNADGCALPVLAVAPLDWTIEPSNAGLVLTDGGTRPHARGTVTTVDGHPASYTVAPDDTVEAIYARFGISAGELDYLNPFRTGVDDSSLKYGTVYNLLPAKRGTPPS